MYKITLDFGFQCLLPPNCGEAFKKRYTYLGLDDKEKKAYICVGFGFELPYKTPYSETVDFIPYSLPSPHIYALAKHKSAQHSFISFSYRNKSCRWNLKHIGKYGVQPHELSYWRIINLSAILFQTIGLN